MIFLDNPFLTRELRRTRAATLAPLWFSLWCVAAATTLALAPVALAVATASWDFPFQPKRWPTVTTLALVHGVGCLRPGGAAGGRVLQGERRDGALWAIQLLPLPAGRVVWLKLWLPIVRTIRPQKDGWLPC